MEDPITGYESDFDILVVVASPAVADKGTLWAEIENKAEALPEMTPVNIIAHDFEYVNKALERGQYFFADIAEEGVLLFDSGEDREPRCRGGRSGTFGLGIGWTVR